jgi:hypothetical protein
MREVPPWEDGSLSDLESTKLYAACNALLRRASDFLEPGRDDDQHLRLILADRRYLDRFAVEGVRGQFLELRHRLNQAIEALTRRMEVRIDERLDSLTGATLLDVADDAEELAPTP